MSERSEQRAVVNPGAEDDCGRTGDLRCRQCVGCWERAWDTLLATGGGQSDAPEPSRFWLVELWCEDDGPYPITCWSVLATSEAEASQIAEPQVAAWEERRARVVDFTVRPER